MALLEHLARTFDLKTSWKWIFLATLVGIVAGLGAIAFHYLCQGIVFSALGSYAGFHPPEPAGEHIIFPEREHELNPWMLLAVVTAGGLVSGFLVYTFAPEAEGHGTDAAIESFHHRQGYMAWHIPIIKLLASAVTLGTGGSGGREGPIAQIGAGFGSVLATRLNLSKRDRRILLAAGIGAGVGSIFRAPLAGALFAAEILYKDSDVESDVLIPAAIAAIVGYTVFTQTLPEDVRFLPLFGPNLHHTTDTVLLFIPYVFLSLVLSVTGILYIKVFYGTTALFKKVPVPRVFRPAIGGALTGLIGIALYFGFHERSETLAVMATGYGTLQLALSNAVSVGIPLLLTVAFVKILTTSLTIGSGGSGGVFGPSMVIGGCLGGATGLLFQAAWPSVVTEPEAFAIVGMAGFFSGVARAPISTIVMVHELTGDYGLLPPTMLVSLLCFLLLRGRTIYEKQVKSRLDSPAHRGDFIVDVLEGLTVGEIYRRDQQIIKIPESMSLDDIVHRLAETHQHYFPVVDNDQNMIGVFSADDVRAYTFDETMWKLANARDVMVADFVSVSPSSDLNSALRRFTSRNLDELPVMDPENPKRLIGFVRRKEVIAAYNKRLMEHKKGLEE
ncbi:chloride channel protein [Calycomorphotria hydatis]|uniref:H(+)/Cl(-) exchange transporter ClcA n=1 Tax=Calycomorphotria hydatis TaxID=2528027 RepID=A0A517T5M8_9PLAN|nr:chloride channel protein [Calycomorphotria hydatis]QDT63677.1 H(+)/Cl(-) exchange transporter ClcA [Calycomorphotria hydatis]